MQLLVKRKFASSETARILGCQVDYDAELDAVILWARERGTYCRYADFSEIAEFEKTKQFEFGIVAIFRATDEEKTNLIQTLVIARNLHIYKHLNGNLTHLPKEKSLTIDS